MKRQAERTVSRTTMVEVIFCDQCPREHVLLDDPAPGWSQLKVRAADGQQHIYDACPDCTGALVALFQSKPDQQKPAETKKAK